jgi:hypothetical protein
MASVSPAFTPRKSETRGRPRQHDPKTGLLFGDAKASVTEITA